MVNHCETCTYYNRLTTLVGYCTLLYAGVKDEIMVLNVEHTWESISETMQMENFYANIIVQNSFGCIFHKKKRENA